MNYNSAIKYWQASLKPVAKSAAYEKTIVESRPDFKFENGAVYRGEWKGLDRHGFGVQKWEDGAKYEGQWFENKAHGKG